MNETALINLVYEFYPKGIDGIKERQVYLNSQEFKKLNALTGRFYEANAERLGLMMDAFKNHPSLRNMQDISSFDFDRCLTYELDILEDVTNTIFKIRVLISALIPSFFVYVLENKVQLNPLRQLNLPVRSKEAETGKFKDEVFLVSEIVKKTFEYDFFPEKYLKFVIPDVSFSDIREGDFTFFNAFFRGDAF